jgi:hypothetical protein
VHETFEAKARYPGAVEVQPMASPDQDIVGQGFKLNQHLLRLRMLLVEPGSAQPLFIFSDLDLNATATPVIKVDVGQQNSLGVIRVSGGLPCQPQHIARRQGGKNDADCVA